MLSSLLSIGPAILITLLILVVLVLVHEAGHFIVARRSGVGVLEFGIGFPPRALVLGRRGGTLYTLNWLPLGGFVRLEGEGEDPTHPSSPRAFAAASLGRRSLIMLAGVTMNLLLALLISVSVTFFADQAAVLQFGSAETGSFAAALGLASGDQLEAIDGHQAAYFASENPLTSLASPLALDPAHQFTLRIRHADGRIETRIMAVPEGPLAIGQVFADTPAAGIGIVAGDGLVGVDRLRFHFLDASVASSYLRAHGGQTVMIHLRHADGRSEDRSVLLRFDTGQGALGLSFFAPSKLSVVAGATPIPHPPLEAVGLGVGRTVNALGMIANGLGSFIAGLVTHPEAQPVVAGPVGMVSVVGSLLGGYPPIFLLWFAGLLSANLALLNLLPISPLDGGKLALMLLRAAMPARIRNRSAAWQKLEWRLAVAGLTALFALMLWVTFFDLTRGPLGP